MIAQEIATQFPELVKPRKDGFLAVNYQGLIPVLIEAIKEQQQLIDNLSASIEDDDNVQESFKSELQKQQDLMELQQQILDQLQKENQELREDMKRIKKELGIDLKASVK